MTSAGWKLKGGDSTGTTTGTALDGVDWSPTGNDALFVADADDAANTLLAVNPRDVRRAETAPMVLTILGADGSLCVGGLEMEAAPGEEYRYSQEYHELYYSKMPRDPRMLPPLTRRGRGGAGAPTGATVAAGTPDSANGSASAALPAAAARHSANGAVGEVLSALPQATAGAGAEPQAGAPVPASKLRQYTEAFRPDWDYAEIKGHVREFAGDQDGSRLVQRLLEKTENLVPIFEEVMVDFDELVKDVFGNYVLQKMFDAVPKAERAAAKDETAPHAREVLDAKMLERLTAQVRGNLKQYSFHTYGCRVMQKALENMKEQDRNVIMREIDDCVTECVFDQNANHVVQKMVEVCPGQCQFIIDAFKPKLRELSCHAYGCRVLQRTFETCHNCPDVDIRPLLEEVLSCINEFTIHQYGNYVVQHGMLNAPDDIRARFVAQLSPSIYALSCSKFASNVAEKVVCVANDEERDKLISILTTPLGESQSGNYLVHMLQDTYANYVVQRLLECSTPAQREKIGDWVMPHVDTINNSVYGRHLLRKMEAMKVISPEFLRLKGIDVTSSDYNGSNRRAAASAGARGSAARGGRNGGRGNRRGTNGHDGMAVFSQAMMHGDQGGAPLSMPSATMMSMGGGMPPFMAMGGAPFATAVLPSPPSGPGVSGGYYTTGPLQPSPNMGGLQPTLYTTPPQPAMFASGPNVFATTAAPPRPQSASFTSSSNGMMTAAPMAPNGQPYYINGNYASAPSQAAMLKGAGGYYSFQGQQLQPMYVSAPMGQPMPSAAPPAANRPSRSSNNSRAPKGSNSRKGEGRDGAKRGYKTVSPNNSSSPSPSPTFASQSS